MIEIQLIINLWDWNFEKMVESYWKMAKKIKNQLGFESDQRTLDAIFEEM